MKASRIAQSIAIGMVATASAALLQGPAYATSAQAELAVLRAALPTQ
jgi:hypothetical protein